MKNLLIFCFLFCVVLSDNYFDKIIYNSISFQFCPRFYTRDGAIGCHTGNSGTTGALLPVRKTKDLDFIRNSTLSEVVAVLRMQLYNNASMHDLINMPNVKGILLSTSGTSAGYSPSVTTPHGLNTPEAGLALHPTYAWNPTGSGLLYKDLHIPIMKITDSKQDYEIWLNSDYNVEHITSKNLYFANIMSYMGPEKMNTPLCLSKYACEVLGGQSVIGYQGTLDTYEKIIIIASNQDSIGEMYSHIKASNEVGVSIAVLLSILDKIHYYDVPSNTLVLYALFQGEHWGGMGSIRYFTDIKNFKCAFMNTKKHNNLNKDICISPLQLYTDFSKIQLDKVESVIVLDQLLPRSNYYFYLHHEDNADPEITEKILQNSKGFSETTLKEASLLPPGTGSYIYKYANISNVYTITGFNSQYVSKNVNGLWDITYDYNIKVAQNSCDFLLRLLSSYVYGITNTTNIECNSAILTSFLNCFAINGNCSALAPYLSLTTESLTNIVGNEPISKYPGIFSIGRQPYMTLNDKSMSVNYNQEYNGDLSITFSPSLIETFYFFYFTKTLSASNKIYPACSSEGTCSDGKTCVLGQCYNSTASFHDAYDIGLTANSYPGTFSINNSIPSPLYAEPIWGGFYGDAPSLYIYQYTPFYLDLVMLAVGLIVTILTYYLFTKLFLSKYGLKLKLD